MKGFDVGFISPIYLEQVWSAVPLLFHAWASEPVFQRRVATIAGSGIPHGSK